MRPSLKRIRECLGIQLSDSLTSAPICILVEGITDATIYKTLLCEKSTKIKHGFENAQLIITSTSGAHKLGRAIELQRQFLNKILILLDNDSTGRQISKSLKNEQVVDESEIRLIPTMKRPKTSDVEIEDMFKPDFIASVLNEKFRNAFTAQDFKAVNVKWSTNFIRATQPSGIQEDAIDSAKAAISLAVEKRGIATLRDEYHDYIDRLTQTLEGMLDTVDEEKSLI